MSRLPPEKRKASAVELVAAVPRTTQAEPSTAAGGSSAPPRVVNAHDRPPYGDGLCDAAPALDCLRDAVYGAQALASLLRKDLLIAEARRVNDLDDSELIEVGTPLSPGTVDGLHASLRIVLSEAAMTVERMASHALAAEGKS